MIGFRTKWIWRIVSVLLLSITLTIPVNAQFKVIGQTDSAAILEGVNVFLEVEYESGMAGFYIDAPQGWQVRHVQLRSERGTIQRLQTQLQEDGRLFVPVGQSVKSEDQLILGMISGLDSVPSRLRFIPVVIEDRRLIERLDLAAIVQVGNRSMTVSATNQVGQFKDLTDGVLLDLPPNSALENSKSFALSLWVKTTGMGELLLSTWSGGQQDNYPVELLLDESGYLEFFRGFNSKHVSMRSQRPIADGNWHFLTLNYNPVSEWTHLFVDGEVEDSLYHSTFFPTDPATRLGIGRRLSDDDGPASRSYSGEIDQLQVSASSWNRSDVQTEMNNPASRGDFLRTFESRSNNDIPTSFSDLRFQSESIHLVAKLDDLGINVEWENHDSDIVRFELERSRDGVQFESIATLLAMQGLHSYRDIAFADGVIFYRVIPYRLSGASAPSRPMKVGVGDLEEIFTVRLEGNHPNPFNPTTTVSYTVEEAQYVRISVWDLSGQMISILVDGTQSPGFFQVPFSAEDLPSGTYFVRMESAAGIQTHQMVLTK